MFPPRYAQQVESGIHLLHWRAKAAQACPCLARKRCHWKDARAVRATAWNSKSETWPKKKTCLSGFEDLPAGNCGHLVDKSKRMRKFLVSDLLGQQPPMPKPHMPKPQVAVGATTVAARRCFKSARIGNVLSSSAFLPAAANLSISLLLGPFPGMPMVISKTWTVSSASKPAPCCLSYIIPI